MSPGKRTGYASLPLHGGKAWARPFSRMALLSREIFSQIVQKHGAREVLRRVSDPYWFQAFGWVGALNSQTSGARWVLGCNRCEGCNRCDGC